MNFHEDCKCCGHRVTAYTHRMNAALARAFLALADAQVRTGGVVRKRDLTLDHSQYGNFQKLRFFGLAWLQEEGWQVTPLGWDWLAGRRALLDPCASLGNEALPDDHLAWATHGRRRKEIGLRDVLPQEWEEREKFRAEKKDAVA